MLNINKKAILMRVIEGMSKLVI